MFFFSEERCGFVYLKQQLRFERVGACISFELVCELVFRFFSVLLGTMLRMGISFSRGE